MPEKSVIVLDIDGTLPDSVGAASGCVQTSLVFVSVRQLGHRHWGGDRQHTDSGIFAEACACGGIRGSPPFDDLESRYAQAYDAVASRNPIAEINGARQFLETI